MPGCWKSAGKPFFWRVAGSEPNHLKSNIRESKASGSTRRKINTAIRRGWAPGRGPVSAFYKRLRPTHFPV